MIWWFCLDVVTFIVGISAFVIVWHDRAKKPPTENEQTAIKSWRATFEYLILRWIGRIDK